MNGTKVGLSIARLLLFIFVIVLRERSCHGLADYGDSIDIFVNHCLMALNVKDGVVDLNTHIYQYLCN